MSATQERRARFILELPADEVEELGDAENAAQVIAETLVTYLDFRLATVTPKENP